MSDKIRFNPQTYDELASKLKSLSSDLKSISDKTTTLAGSSAAKAVLNLTTSGIFNLKGISRSFTYANAAGGLTAARSALRACSEEAEQLARRVTQAKSLFQANERSLVNCGSENAASGSASGKAAILLGNEASIADLARQEWAKQWQNYIKKPAKESEQHKRQRIEEANKKRMFEDTTQEHYGGRQHGPLVDVSNGINIRQYCNIIERNTGRRPKGNELLAYVRRINDEGCGYTALCNSIFDGYEGRAEEFERVFGYPMTDENGQYNHSMLLVDIYSRTDNHTLIFGIETANNNQDRSFSELAQLFTYDSFTDTTGRGCDVFDIFDRMEIFANEKGFDLSGGFRNITTDNYAQATKQGEMIMVFVKPITLRDENGEFLARGDSGTWDHVDGGHYMTVTGTTDDGRFTVSTWGQIVYIDPADYTDAKEYQFIGTKVTPQ